MIKFSDVEAVVDFVEIASINETVEGVLKIICIEIMFWVCIDCELGGLVSVERFIVTFGLDVCFEPRVDIFDPLGKRWAVSVPHRVPESNRLSDLSVVVIVGGSVNNRRKLSMRRVT